MDVGRSSGPTGKNGSNTVDAPTGPLCWERNAESVPSVLADEPEGSSPPTWSEAIRNYRRAVANGESIVPDWEGIGADLRDFGREVTAWAEETVLLTFWPDPDVPPVDRINAAISAHEAHLWDSDGTVSPTLAEAVGGRQWSGVTILAPGSPHPHLHIGLAVGDPIGGDRFRPVRDSVVGSSPALPVDANGSRAVSVESGERADGNRVADYLARNVTAKASTAGRTAVVASGTPAVMGPVGSEP